MTSKRIGEVWSPAGAPWSAWVKPALFATLRVQEVEPNEQPWKGELPSWLECAQAAVIIDLPGPAALELGLAFGAHNYQPVLAINATSDSDEAIDMREVLALLAEGARHPRAFSTTPQALPAFILDSRRAGSPGRLGIGTFDNRWTIFAGDLPRAADFERRGIRSVVIVQEGVALLEDLAAIAWGYAAAGLDVRVADAYTQRCAALNGTRPNWFIAALRELSRRFALQRLQDGSYGHRVEAPRSSHG